jgi:glycolate oxidase iron-sulfur subunit
MVGRMQRLTPVDGPLLPRRHTGRYPASSQRRTTVGFFPGCVGSVVHSAIDRKAIDLLRLGGAEVLVPRASRCCGAIPHHAAAPDEARRLAMRNIEAFADTERVVTDIAGCGAMLKQYGELLRDDPAWAARAEAFAAKVRDIHEALAELTLPAPRHRVETTATYHEACHLAHAQGVSAEPRALMGSVPGVEWRQLEEATLCCGAAGSYNLEQPEMADRLGERKARAVEATGAAVCLTANVGCAMQIKSTLGQRGADVLVAHPVELLHAAHFGSAWPPGRR